MANKNVTLIAIPGGAPAYFRVLWADTGGTLPGTIDGTSFWVYFQNFTYLASSELFTAVPGTSIAYNLLVNTHSPVNSTWRPGNIENPPLIPEPSSFALVGLGLVALRLRHRSR